VITVPVEVIVSLGIHTAHVNGIDGVGIVVRRGGVADVDLVLVTGVTRCIGNGDPTENENRDRDGKDSDRCLVRRAALASG
jgi:hypothetical protein